jgi:hypothetical protein
LSQEEAQWAWREGRLMSHIHIVVADHTGNAYEGHLFPGTIVKEYVEGFLIRLKGARFERRGWREDIKAYPSTSRKIRSYACLLKYPLWIYRL